MSPTKLHDEARQPTSATLALRARVAPANDTVTAPRVGRRRSARPATHVLDAVERDAAESAGRLGVLPPWPLPDTRTGAAIRAGRPGHEPVRRGRAARGSDRRRSGRRRRPASDPARRHGHVRPLHAGARHRALDVVDCRAGTAAGVLHRSMPRPAAGGRCGHRAVRGSRRAPTASSTGRSTWASLEPPRSVACWRSITSGCCS